MLVALDHINNHANYRADADDRLSQFARKLVRLVPTATADQAKLTSHFDDDLIDIDYAISGDDVLVKARRYDHDRGIIAIANHAGACGYNIM